MANILRDKVPNTFVTIVIGEGNDSLTLVNRMDKKSVSNNLHLTNLSVDLIDAQTIKYSFSVQYHPSTFRMADTLKLERIVDAIMSNEALDKNNIIDIKFGYVSGSPYTRNIRKESYNYKGTIIEMKTSVQQNYIEYSFIATGVYKLAENTTLCSELRFTTKDHITTWIRTKLLKATAPNTNGGLFGGKIWSVLKQAESKGISNSKTNTKMSNTAKICFDFRCDYEIPSIEDLYGLKELYKEIGINMSNTEAVKIGSELNNILDFSAYSSDAQLDKAQGSLMFPANFNLILLLKGICDKINLLCGMDGIKRTQYRELYNHQFEIVFDPYTLNKNTYGTIYLTDVTNIKNKPNFNYVFNYGFISQGDDLIDHTVISWDCDFNATALIHDSVIANELAVTQVMSGFGEALAVPANGTPLEGNMAMSTNVVDNLMSGKQSFVKVKQTWAYPYEATLTVLGNPEPVDICRKVIQVIPMINNHRHHTAGYYLVKSVTHNIDSSMAFTTTYGLIRLDDEHAQLFESGQGNVEDLESSMKAMKDKLWSIKYS